MQTNSKTVLLKPFHRVAIAKTRLMPSVALTLIGILSPTIARGDYEVPIPNYAPGNMMAISQAAAFADVMRNVYGGGVSSTRKPTARPSQIKPSKQSVSLNFRSDLSISRQVQADIVKRVRQESPSDADRLAPVLASGQAMSAYSKLVASYGLRSDNVADAMTAYIVTKWLLANDVRTNPSRTAVQAVRAQVAQICLNNPQLRSESARQMLAESLIYQFMMLDSLRERVIAEGNPAQIRQIAEMANRNGTNDLGVDLRSIDLANTGFRKRS